MFLQESRYNIRAKSERDTTVILTPARDVLVRVGPEKVAQQAAVRDLDRV
jgi:hypothetical protein